MARKREEEPEKENNERWLLTYADLITLLMIFFIVLYSMSKVDADKFRAIADSLNAALGGGTPSKYELAKSPMGPSLLDTGNPQAKATTSGTTDTQDNTAKNQAGQANKDQTAGTGNVQQENASIEGIKAQLDKFAEDNGFQATLVSSIEERGLVVRIQETLLFESGSDIVTPQAHEILKKISTVLETVPNFIKIEGHTDNLPIHTAKFPSNWELSVLRATNVLEILSTEGGISPDRLSATGYGEYRPIAPNTTEAGRTRNRRVDLVVLRSQYNVTEAGVDETDQQGTPQAGKTE